MGDFTVQISTELVRKLVENGETPKRNSRKRPVKEPAQKRTSSDEKKTAKDSETLKGGMQTVWPVQPPLLVPATKPLEYSNPELDAIRSTIRESERVLEDLNTQKEMVAELVKQKAKDLHEKEFKLPYQKPVPCLADYEACRKCYEEHAHEILKCGPLTKAYYDCVQKAKQVHSSPPS